ncbi:uncharacterized protein C1orf112 homolog, partial [Centruroides sculpturatus]|uniref:uncharacterized protein C1orf112 homolog n=1 Tax=Centruroides sculpturatus TaxID=218467 RepID=UPI000C6D6E5F
MCFSQFHLPVYLSGNLCQGKSQKMISFYELVCIRVCSFISAMPVQYFPILEKVLFNYVKSSGVYATLISDILCFVARYGSADLCFSYCSFLVELLMKSDAENNINMLHIRFLLRRIVKFLIPKYKKHFIEKFPLSENLNLWSNLSLNTFLKDGLYTSKKELLNIYIVKLQQINEEEMTPQKYFDM